MHFTYLLNMVIIYTYTMYCEIKYCLGSSCLILIPKSLLFYCERNICLHM